MRTRCSLLLCFALCHVVETSVSNGWWRHGTLHCASHCYWLRGGYTVSGTRYRFPFHNSVSPETHSMTPSWTCLDTVSVASVTLWYPFITCIYIIRCPLKFLCISPPLLFVATFPPQYRNSQPSVRGLSRHFIRMETVSCHTVKTRCHHKNTQHIRWKSWFCPEYTCMYIIASQS